MESLWEKISDLDKLNYASQAEQPMVKSQFRMKKNAASSQKTSIQIHLYASLILFICASTPKAKISLTSDVQYQLHSENQLIIHKNERSIQLRLTDSENTTKWVEALSKLGITERDPQSLPLSDARLQSMLPSYSPPLPAETVTLTGSVTPTSFNSRRDSQPSTRSASSNQSSLNNSSAQSHCPQKRDGESTLTLSIYPSDSSCEVVQPSPSHSESTGRDSEAKASTNNKQGKKKNNNQKLNSKRRASQQENIYAAPETFKPSMEHFIINTNYLYRKACTNYHEYLTNLRGLERIPEEQECCD